MCTTATIHTQVFSPQLPCMHRLVTVTNIHSQYQHCTQKSSGFWGAGLGVGGAGEGSHGVGVSCHACMGWWGRSSMSCVSAFGSGSCDRFVAIGACRKPLFTATLASRPTLCFT